eukprot:CAMPEP_0116558532 /NCGR_PEP_ID=MMETSP0397-20121206/9861_1 /TAXON_ID=216820 /ORGANISM="Cyclophora tenuis, Strain ECT3854" /LENGTH=38 /DNA_ID= /DNA_START= /DNA_END= /DNA_ORIENTATION=
MGWKRSPMFDPTIMQDSSQGENEQRGAHAAAGQEGRKV